MCIKSVKTVYRKKNCAQQPIIPQTRVHPQTWAHPPPWFHGQRHDHTSEFTASLCCCFLKPLFTVAITLQPLTCQPRGDPNGPVCDITEGFTEADSPVDKYFSQDANEGSSDIVPIGFTEMPRQSVTWRMKSLCAKPRSHRRNRMCSLLHKPACRQA